MNKGKILHVIDKMDPKLGGVSQAVRTMILGLSTYGIYNEVASLDSPESSFLKEDSFTINALGPSKGPWSYGPNVLPWLVDNLARFDSIILHGLWLYNGYAIFKALSKYRKSQNVTDSPRFYVMPHGMLDPYFQKASGRKIKALRNWAYWKLIESKVVNTADGILFTCEEERRLAHIPFSPYRPKSEKVVGLGVEEPPAFHPDMQKAFLIKCPEVANQPYLLFLGRIHEKKGVDLLINAYSAVINKLRVAGSLEMVDSTLDTISSEAITIPKLVIAGPGLDTAYGEEIKKLVSEDKYLDDNIIFTGMLTGEAKWGAFYGCEAFVLPSHQENFGIAVVEALACGKPVLISNQIHIWREIDSEGGALIADDTQHGTNTLLETWFSLSKNERKIISTNAREAYKKSFAIEANINNLMNDLQLD